MKEKLPTLSGNKHISVLFFHHAPHLFHLSTENYVSNPSEMEIKLVGKCGGNTIVYTPNPGTKRKKFFNHIIYEGKAADSIGI